MNFARGDKRAAHYDLQSTCSNRLVLNNVSADGFLLETWEMPPDFACTLKRRLSNAPFASTHSESIDCWDTTAWPVLSNLVGSLRATPSGDRASRLEAKRSRLPQRPRPSGPVFGN